MSFTLAQTLPIRTWPPIRPDLTVVCLLPLLGLTLSAVVLSWVSPETSSLMFTALG